MIRMSSGPEPVELDLYQQIEGLNDEQRQAVTTTEGPVLILAGPGSGKTRVVTFRIAYLIEHEGVRPWNILAVTFTNKAAREMKERLEPLVGPQAKEIHVGTFHSICARVLRSEMETMDFGRTRNFTILDDDEQQTMIKAAIKDLNLNERQFQPRAIHGAISRAKNELLTPRQFAESANKYFDEIAARVYQRYEDQLRTQNAVDFDDLILLTHQLWRRNPEALLRAQNRYHYIHVDEFQDCNRAQYELVRLLALGLPPLDGKNEVAFTGKRNLCVVADEDQCLVAGTQITMANGMQKPIEAIQPGDQILSAYGSGDFRAAHVQSVMRRDYKGGGIRITMQSGRSLVSTPEHMHFAGYRLGITPQTYFTYLMYKRGVGYRLGTSQVYTNGQVEPVVGFALRARHERADAAWIISTHQNENEARMDEYILSLRYQIPTLPFGPRKGASQNGLVHDPSYIQRVFAAFDTEKSGARLLEDVGLAVEYPHFRPRSRNSRHMHIVLTLCADRRGATPLHRISIDGNDPQAQDALLSHGFRVRRGKPGTAGWRVEAMNSQLERVLEQAQQMCRVIDADIVFLARLGKNDDEIIKGNALPFLPAASVRVGMVMFDAQGEYDIVTQVEREAITVPVYDLNIEKTHNFIANGIVTHNSIYAWRGASSKNIIQLEHDFPDRQLIILGRNYRSTQNILDAAMHVVRRNPNRIDKELWTDKGAGEMIEVREVYNEEEEGKFVADTVRLLQARGEAKLAECAILYRTNAQSRAIEEQLLRAGVPYIVIGSRKFYERKEIRDVIAYLRLIANPRDAISLQRIINVPPRKIGEVTVRQLLGWAEGRGQTPEDAIASIDQHPTLGTAAKEALKRFAALIADLRTVVQTIPLDQAIDRLLERTGYASEIRDGSEEGEERWRNVLELRRVAGDYAEIDPDAALALFLENVALIGGADTAATNSEDGTLVNEPRDAVTLITLHAAKGLEFPVVFMVGMEEGVLPHSRSMEHQEQLEEERRLAYVGITRAMRRLYLVRAFRRTFYGGNSNLQEPSRFLGDIPAKLTRQEDRPSGKASVTAKRPHDAPRSTTRPQSGRGSDPAPYVPRGQRPSAPELPMRTSRPFSPPPDIEDDEPPAPAPEPRTPKPGDTVRHRIYGKGMVLKVIAERDTTTVEVLFERESIGKKTLDLSFAKLDIIG
jgi:DNA helicase-2/ATP-dependent DNA helicase PcrA